VVAAVLRQYAQSPSSFQELLCGIPESSGNVANHYSMSKFTEASMISVFRVQLHR
jgi:hypothetical protein